MMIDFDPQKNIRIFINRSDTTDQSGHSEHILTRLRLIVTNLAYIMENETTYKTSCPISWNTQVESINKITSQYAIQNKAYDMHHMSRLIISVFRLVYEKCINTGEWNNDIEGDLLRFFLGSNSNANDEERLQAHFLGYSLQSTYLSRKKDEVIYTISLEKDNIRKISASATEEANRLADTLNKSLNSLDEHRKSVKDIASGYNFVRLAGAFNELVKNKKKDLVRSTFILNMMGFTSLLPLVGSIIITAYLWTNPAYTAETLKDKLLYSAPIIIPLEFILLYFFRVILKENLSLKAQILQLELRYSVCAFIEGYADFTKDIQREKLEKFEALVFSGITPDPSAVPGTFDGMDQLLNLAKAAGGK